MIFYNYLTELVASQFLLIALFEATVVAISFFVFKKKLTVMTFLFSIIITSVISLISIIVARGSYGGMAYHERFGWPFQYYYVSRNIEIGTNVSIPYSFRFDFLKFIANMVYWGFIPVIVMLWFEEKNKKYKLFAICSLVFYVLLTLGCWYSNVVTETREKIPGEITLKENELPLADTLQTPDQNIISIKRRIIELEYPDFKDFENQKSFAGQSVKIDNSDNEYYFAYIVFGSGLPIVEATCFRTDSIHAYKVGEFPDMADSFIGYKDIDPKTCRGIK